MKPIYKTIRLKIFLIILILPISIAAYSTTYYISNSGNDANDGTTVSTPWQSLNKVNSITFKPGDQVLFKQGDTFYGSLRILGIGTTSAPITFSSYGSGAKPVITGFTDVSQWNNLGNNIWESTNAVSTLSTGNIVAINGINVPKGRWPNLNNGNGGYINYTAQTTTSLTSAELESSPNWNGATVSIKAQEYFLPRRLITSHIANSINWTTSLGISTNGFFIQDHIQTLDQQNEWFYNPSNKKLYIYSTTSPVNVKIATVENLVDYGKTSYNYTLCDYINVDNISFIGSNGTTIQGYPSLVAGYRVNTVKISDCDISFSGGDGIKLYANNVTVMNNTIINTNGSGITSNAGTNLIRNNSLSNISLILGVGDEYANTAIILNNVEASKVEYNTVMSCGFNGISFGGNSIIEVKRNFISDFNKKLTDGGAITTGGVKALGTIISENICIGNPENSGLVCGIYLDDGSTNTEVSNNTVANCSWVGIYLHNASYNNVHHNVVFNNDYTQLRAVDDINPAEVKSNIIDNNLFIAKTSSQTVAVFSSKQDNLINFGVFSYNTYARPILEGATILYGQPSTGSKWVSLSEWQTFSGQDLNSSISTLKISDVSDIKIEYNATTVSKTATLSTPMIDFKGNKYYDSVTLEPFSSVMLIKDPNPVVPVVPVFVEALLENEQPAIVKLNYNWDLSNVIPATDAFTIFVNTNPVAVNSVVVSGKLVSLSLASPVGFGSDLVTVSYTQPVQNALQTASSGKAASLNTVSVKNSVSMLKQAEIIPTHFIPVWQGENGLNHMNFLVVSALLEDQPLQDGDEIAVFDGSVCVGSMKLSKSIVSSDNTSFLGIPVSQTDGSGNGFTDQDSIVFKIWDDQNQREMSVKAVSYRNDLSGWSVSGKFTPGATSVVELVSFEEFTQSIFLLKGYNLISTYVAPSNSDASAVTQSLSEAGTLVKIQDESGNSLENWGNFGGWVNKLGELQQTEGYKIKVANNCTLQVIGRPIALPLDISLKAGWNIVSFPRTDAIDAVSVVQSLIDSQVLIKVQDELGNSIENWGIFGGWKNSIGTFNPGKAYKIKVSANAVLTIQENYMKSAILPLNRLSTSYYRSVVSGNGTDHMNLNLIGLREAGIEAGDELGIFDGSTCVGTFQVSEADLAGGAALVAASFSNDQCTDGFTDGHPILLYLWKTSSGAESQLIFEVQEGTANFTKNSSVFARLKSATTAASGFEKTIQVDVFPNPSLGRFSVRFSMIPDAESQIEILDLSGRKIQSRRISGLKENFDLSQQPTGIYLVKTRFNSKEFVQKLIIN